MPPRRGPGLEPISDRLRVVRPGKRTPKRSSRSRIEWPRPEQETLSYYRLPLAHHKHMKSTNMLERLNQEIKRRTHVVRIFPSLESCLRLVRA
ncbi:MAG: transposase, partial [Rhodomicrobium sp.]